MRAGTPDAWPPATYLPAAFFVPCLGFFFFLSFRWLLLPFPMAISPNLGVGDETRTPAN
jgi:hypothetical protein